MFKTLDWSTEEENLLEMFAYTERQLPAATSAKEQEETGPSGQNYGLRLDLLCWHNSYFPQSNERLPRNQRSSFHGFEFDRTLYG